MYTFIRFSKGTQQYESWYEFPIDLLYKDVSSLDTKWRILASCPDSQYIGTLLQCMHVHRSTLSEPDICCTHGTVHKLLHGKKCDFYERMMLNLDCVSFRFTQIH